MMKKMKAKLFVSILMMNLAAGAIAAVVVCCAHKKKKCFLGDVKKKAERAFEEIENKLEC